MNSETNISSNYITKWLLSMGGSVCLLQKCPFISSIVLHVYLSHAQGCSSVDHLNTTKIFVGWCIYRKKYLQGSLASAFQGKKERKMDWVQAALCKEKTRQCFFKWLWRLDNSKEGGWQNLITKMYWPPCINGLPLFKNPISPTWTAISSIINTIHVF